MKKFKVEISENTGIDSISLNFETKDSVLDKNYIESPETQAVFERALFEGNTQEDKDNYVIICNKPDAPKTYNGFDVIQTEQLPLNYMAFIPKTELNGKA
jgi:hypothetical protein